jgi:hypothetical protein
MGRESIEPSNMLYLKRSSNPLFTANTEEWWQMELFCITITLDLIQQQWLLEQYGNWNFSFFHHLSYSLEVNPSDYHSCKLLKNVLCGFVCNWILLHRWHLEVDGLK